MSVLGASDFATVTPPQPLAEGEVHLWFFPRWPHSRDAAQSDFVRGLLGAYLGRDVSSEQIDRDERGKPFIRGEGLRFNLAHSGEALLVGLSVAAEIGVDLETPRRPRPAIALARRYFAPTEADALAALPEERQQDAFLRLWTCKEAVLKARGQGIASGLASVTFSLKDGIPHPRAERSAASWSVQCMVPAPDYVGAVAWLGDNRPVRAFKVIL